MSRAACTCDCHARYEWRITYLLAPSEPLWCVADADGVFDDGTTVQQFGAKFAPGGVGVSGVQRMGRVIP